MGPEEFRKLALSFPGTEEREHMRHPDFRVGGKIFATIGYPDESFAMVRLAPAEQERFLKTAPDIFVPVKGAWGRQGCTHIRLKAAKKPHKEKICLALEAAWQNRVGLKARIDTKKLRGV